MLPRRLPGRDGQTIMCAQQQTLTRIEVPDAPEIPGLTFRGFRGDGDFPVLHALLLAANVADGVDWRPTIEDIRRNYSHMPHCDPYTDLIVAEVDGVPAAYGRCDWWERLEGTRVYYHFRHIRPEWRGRGIETALIGWQEQRLREVAAAHLQGPKQLASECLQAQATHLAALEAAGYTPEAYHAVMGRPHLEDIPDAPLPEGIEVRPALPEHYRAIWDAEQEAFRDHWGYVPPQEGDYEHYFLEDPVFDPTVWCIAWEGDQVVGMVRGFIDEKENEALGRKRGWTERISVRRPWRRRGVARALLCQSLRLMKERGMTGAALGVHTGNPNGAFQLYQSVGFEVVRITVALQKPLEG